ncbi:penicillin-binding protein activator [Salinarimonas soli]|uniref:Penicillin-binding protein activator n=1 Tax=Salinarimonas soli TaxID=1638099 RepID=A0A5B2W1G3_9HYPH|nr:penicillin-binding protein activator [Salinarimonas soli]KAA2244346.1 penicillin-binding protein activator [Salinarimonas soli]
MTPPTAFGRRGLLKGSLAAATTLSLGGCVSTLAGGSRPSPVAAAPAPEPEPAAGPALGNGPVRVALLLPLTGPGQGAAVAASMRNAAELALAEFQGPDLTVLLKDDKGTPEGARDAATAALAEGAELILGPLFAGSVAAAGGVARAGGRPVIAFSTDASVATRGVYLIGFLPGPEVDRVVDYAASQGRRSVAGLIPETTYGNVVEAAFREAAARNNMRVAGVERYAAGAGAAAAARLAPVIGGASPQADTLFIPETADNLAGLAQGLQSAGFNPQRVKPIGTAVWNDPRIARIPGLQGGWYAAPDQAGFQAFAGRYRAKYNTEPTRIASLAYDAVSYAAALSRTQGSQRFSEGVLTNPSGAAGIDGLFRLKADGTNERGLAIFELRGGASAVVNPAPRAFGSSGA